MQLQYENLALKIEQMMNKMDNQPTSARPSQSEFDGNPINQLDDSDSSSQSDSGVCGVY